ncbi:hypothetical protein JVT61DRAFT_8661 [Boletus reticuloceps]|uniref:Uncharacterized protein n=1 Tax=Boletus reticuloceps TaxID=495285 RepID=A0A8I2YZH4_9AGAM|nr:hypothetical protein JVT61DRAFT_8661 [Boletus reticuloceps]
MAGLAENTVARRYATSSLQLAEVYRCCEECSQALDYISRALYAYERAFLGAFSFTRGNNRLDFDRAVNRPFFPTIHQKKRRRNGDFKEESTEALRRAVLAPL